MTTLNFRVNGQDKKVTPDELWGISWEEWEAFDALEKYELLKQTQEDQDLWDRLHADVDYSEKPYRNPDEDIETTLYLNLNYNELA